jgi:hypothetical protein
MQLALFHSSHYPPRPIIICHNDSTHLFPMQGYNKKLSCHIDVLLIRNFTISIVYGKRSLISRM